MHAGRQPPDGTHGSNLPLPNDRLLVELGLHGRLARAFQLRPVSDAFGVRGSQTVFTALVGTIATCSGLILWREWRNDLKAESEYGEWTNRQLFYAIVFAISFFVGFISLAGWYFSA